jgi:8-oxo-dGTP pyrophosphatase MutT (NUDIX family)
MTGDITQLYQQYIEVFPQEQDGLRLFEEQLREQGESGIISRSTFDPGHITAGAIIVALPSRHVLMIDHLVLQKRLQPGGHVEPEDASILDAAYREVLEETGLGRDVLKYVPLSDQNPELPFNIAVQDIPENSAKREPMHSHFDFWYLFVVPDGAEAHSDDIGVANHRWVPMLEFAAGSEFTRAAEKIDKLLLS